MRSFFYVSHHHRTQFAPIFLLNQTPPTTNSNSPKVCEVVFFGFTHPQEREFGFETFFFFCSRVFYFIFFRCRVVAWTAQKKQKTTIESFHGRGPTRPKKQFISRVR